VPAPSVLPRSTAELPPATGGADSLAGSDPPAGGSLDPSTEATILGLLGQPMAPENTHGMQARVARLVAAFQAIPTDARAHLHARLAQPHSRDPLAYAFCASLHTATQTRLLRALAGDLVPLSPHDAMTREGFAEQLPTDPLLIEPPSLVIHPRLAPHATARVSLTSEYGPPVDSPTVHAVVRVFDAQGAEHGAERIPWLSALPTSDAAMFTFDRAGSYRIDAELIQSGLVIAKRQRGIEVTSPAADIATEAGLHAATTARASGAGTIGTAIAASAGALRVSAAGDLATATQMSPEQRSEAHARLVDRMAQDMDPAARAQLGDDRALLEFAEASADGTVAPERPAGPAADQITLAGMDRPSVDVSADPGFLRRWVERVYIASGLDGVDALPGVVIERAADDFAISRNPTRQAFAMQSALPALRHQIQILKGEIAAFEQQFAGAATKLVGDTLDESERVARAELAHYGIDVSTAKRTFRGPDDLPRMTSQTITTTAVHGGDNPAARDMARAAGELAANQREIDRMHARLRELRDVQNYRERGEPGTGAGAGAEPAPSVDPRTLASAPDAQHLPEVLASLDRLVIQADRAHQTKIAEHTEKYPILASYKRTTKDGLAVDADALDRVQGSGRGQAIYDRIAPVLGNIAATRGALGHRLNVWKEPRVVQLTRAQMLVAPGSLRAAIVERKIGSEQDGGWTDWAIMALSFGLAVLTAIPTGGSSVVAAVVVAADLAGAIADVYLVVDHVRAYQLDAAKAGTDLDAQARAISAEQPSLLWLALDLVATGVGLSAAAKTFSKVAKDLAKAKRVGAGGARLAAEEADAAIAQIHQLARDGKISADAAERAEGEIRIAADAEHRVGRAAEGAQAGEHGHDADAAHARGEQPSSRGHHDTRSRISADQLPQLQQRLGVQVVIDDTLSNGVELHYATRKGALGIGTDIEPTVLRIGRDAVIDDVLAHRATIARVTKYNGVAGKLRGLWDRFVVETQGVNPFRRGSLGWEAFEEIRKIDELIVMRRARWNPHTLDAHTLEDEIRFLEGRRTHYEEIRRTAEETGAIKGAGHIDASDVGRVTDEAKAKGYKLPGADQGANPDAYYYRNSKTAPGEYELARKPSAPAGTEPYRAVTKDGRFERLEHGDMPRPQTLITEAWTDEQVIAHLWSDDSFSAFASLLERERLATRDEINAAVIAKRGTRGSIIDDTVRGNVKDVFRPRLVQRLTDPKLDAQASWRQMRRMLDGLDNADRGNLCELWYKARHTTGAEQHVPMKVARTGESAGRIDDRVIDIVEGNTAIEIKDVAGPIDKEQFRAYADMLEHEIEVAGSEGPIAIRKLRYVFTRPEGARANLAFIADELDKRALVGRLSVDVFDSAGTRHRIMTSKEARAMLATLGGSP
jgi:hypothetical protein